jgi:hypothetical protein
LATKSEILIDPRTGWVVSAKKHPAKWGSKELCEWRVFLTDMDIIDAEKYLERIETNEIKKRKWLNMALLEGCGNFIAKELIAKATIREY